MNETRYIRWLGLICAGFVIVAAVLFYNTVKLLPFNDEIWRESNRQTRGRMVKNLLENNDFTGFSRGK